MCWQPPFSFPAMIATQNVLIRDMPTTYVKFMVERMKILPTTFKWQAMGADSDADSN